MGENQPEAYQYFHSQDVSECEENKRGQKPFNLPIFQSHNCQSIGVLLFLIKYSLVFEKGLLPKKPREADRGDG